MSRDPFEAASHTRRITRPRKRTLSPPEPCPAPVARVSAAGAKTRVTITNAKDAKPGRDHSPAHVPHSPFSRRPARSSYNQVYTFPRSRTFEPAAEDQLTGGSEARGREGEDRERHDHEDEELLPDHDGELSGLSFDFTFSAFREKTNSDPSDVDPMVVFPLGSAGGSAIVETAIARSTWLGTCFRKGWIVRRAQRRSGHVYSHFNRSSGGKYHRIVKQFCLGLNAVCSVVARRVR